PTHQQADRTASAPRSDLCTPSTTKRRSRTRRRVVGPTPSRRLSAGGREPVDHAGVFVQTAAFVAFRDQAPVVVARRQVRHGDAPALRVDQVDAQGGRIAVSNLTPGDYYLSVIAERYEGGRFHEKASAVNAFTIAR
ncbi:hypothetical protein OIV42_32890, partial [Burkholderia pseudomallei]|nr:hypothetical protein [Burkholderia pseudomallei]